MGCAEPGCDGNGNLPFECRRCGQKFCSDHRLPENHDCPGLSATHNAQPEAWFPGDTEPTQSRSASRWRNVLLILLVAGVIASAVGFVAGNPGGVPTVEFSPNGEDSQEPVATAEPTPENTDKQSTDSGSEKGLNEQEVERLIHQAVNDYRAEQGVGELNYDDELAEIARYHSGNMAKDGEIYHTSPDGQTVEDRYERFGYDCRVPSGDNTYQTSGENVAKTYFEEPLTNGDYYRTAEELAEGIVEQWINSDGHRANLVDEDWRGEGIGVSVTEEGGSTAVYVTQNFC